MKSCDYETYLIVPGLVAPKPVVLAVSDGPHDRLLTPREARDWFEEQITRGEVLAGANFSFDLGVLCTAYSEMIPLVFQALERGLIRCTHLRQPLLDIARGTLLQGADGAPLQAYSLSNVCEKVLGIKVAKENTPRLTYAHLDGVPFELWSQAERDYPKTDSRRTLQAVEAQSAGPEGDLGLENLKLEPHEARAMWALHLMACWGPRTDPEMVEDVVREVTGAHDAAVKRFTEAGIYRGEGWCRREKWCEGSTPHRLNDPLLTEGADGQCWRPWLSSKVGTKDGGVLAALVTQAYEGSPPPTDSGGVSTDRDTLLESGDPLLMEFAETGANETEFKTYLDVIRRGTQVPICVRYDPIKRTGRVGARDPNLQNLPAGGKVRPCFVPRNFRHPDVRERRVFNSTDYPSLELWTLAETCLDLFGESELAKLLRTGLDMHSKLVATVLHMPYEEAIRLKKSGDDAFSKQRRCAKEVNYGLGGGMSDETLILTARKKKVRFCQGVCGAEKVLGTKGKAEGKPLCAACLEEAQKFIRAWHEMLPEMRDYFRQVKEEISSGIVVVHAPEGLPPMYCAETSFNAGANKKFQGRAARAAKEALWRIARACYVEEDSALYGCRPTMFVHDEVIAELPELIAHEAAVEQARLMGQALKMWCPKVYCEAACPRPTLMRRYFKGVEETYDAGERLIPSWPEDWDWLPDQEIMESDRARRAT